MHSDALEIFLYFDELEVCNPLGSKAKIHKLGEFMCMHVLYCVVGKFCGVMFGEFLTNFCQGKKTNKI